MIAHAGLVVGNYEKAKAFYTTILAPIGYQLYMDLPEYKVIGFSDAAHSSFWLSERGGPVPGHIAFAAKSKAEVEEFYKVALAAGGIDNGAPGYRANYSPGYYAAFIHDADKNNVEVVWYDESKESKA